ncbi:MAG: hypothetical protein H0X37_07845 [Herpetosiphonaceae bacterium]|nr:hypothetical protein [Herpetosiphonaceae bacterium]
MATTCATCGTAATTNCSLCRQGLCQEHANRWHPLITARQLATTIFNTAVKTPNLLSDILLKEVGQVDYCPDCRELIAERRQSEQIKFLLCALLLMAMVIGLPTLLLLH